MRGNSYKGFFFFFFLFFSFFFFFLIPNSLLSPSFLLVADQPTRILHGHNDEVTCVCISVELDMAVSGAKDGRCVIHSLRKVCIF